MAKRSPGSAGGTETLKRHGIAHFREIGKRGFQSLKNRYFDGNGAEAMTWLRSRRNELQVAGLVDEKLDRQLAEGASVAVEELPVLLEPENDPLFKEGDYWQNKIEQERRVRKR